MIGFRDHRDAQRVMEVMPKRFGKYGLTIHPTKTRLVPFRPPSPWAKGDRGEPRERPGTFDLLGFTHYWGRSQRGYWIVKWKTASDRFSRAVRSIDSWCQANRHLPIGEQQQKLNGKATRTLRVLRCHGELGSVVTVSPRSRVTLAEVALSPQPPSLTELEHIPSPPPAVSAGSRAHRPFSLQDAANP